MPIYEFRCQKCNTLFETLVSSTSPEEVACKQCGSKEVKKTISAASYRLSSSSSGSKIPAGALSGCSSRSGFS
ncbi:MAG: zinc ribbon domain-containing protein [Desulfobacteraceae bacterium]|nr:zinc ribbon domain-containing protein [Desulfobacteraceae bacterium]